MIIKQSSKRRWTQILCIALAALMVLGVVAVLLSSCAPSVNSPEVSSSTDAENTEPTPSAEDLCILSGGQIICSVIRADRAGDGIKEAAITIRRTIEKITGVLPDISEDFLLPGETIDPDAYEILVGPTNRDESSAVDAGLTNYDSYSISIVGRKLVLLASDDEGYRSAATWLCDRLYELAAAAADARSELSIPADTAVASVGQSMLGTLPIYEDGSIETIWDCGDDCKMYIIKNTDSAAYTAYQARLTEAGFAGYAQNQIGDNLYATYTSADGKYVLNTVYTAYENKSRLIIEPLSGTALPTVESEYTQVFDAVTLTQVGLETDYSYASPTQPTREIGMLYILRLRDGRFIIIDGGFNDDKNVELLISSLRRQAKDPNDITVAAWIFSHHHGDHTGLIRKLASSAAYRKLVNVERFIFNFPSEEQFGKMGEGYPTSTYSAIASYKDAEVIKAHPGQVFSYGGAQIEYYSTIELIAPTDCDTGNTVSAVFSVTAEGQKIMFLGDSSNLMSNTLVKCYGTALASDIVQVAHHGANGGTVELYRLIDMKVAFWPLGVWDYYNYNGYGRKNEEWNSYLFSSPKMIEIILAGYTERTVTLPYEPTEKSFPPDTEPDPRGN